MSICKLLQHKKEIQNTPLQLIYIDPLLVLNYSKLELVFKLQVKMEANRKLRGLIKAKLIPFYRPAKPSSPSIGQYTTKVKPSQTSPSTASVEFHGNLEYVWPKQNVSLIVADNKRDLLYDKLYGAAGDESVDTKATSYISSVQERFKHERNN